MTTNEFVVIRVKGEKAMLAISLILFLIIVSAALAFIFRNIMQKNVVLATKHLDELNQDYTQREDELNRKTNELNQKAQEIIAKAEAEAQGLRVQIIKEAERERDTIISGARTQGSELIQQAEKSRQALIAELEERIAKEAIKRACELIQLTLPDEFKRDVHCRWVEELMSREAAKIERLKVPSDIKEIRLSTAFSLSEQQRKKISERLKELLHRDVMLKEEVDAQLVAGLIITIGSLVLDGSLRNRVEEKAKTIQGESKSKKEG